jgi:hypothetical protein
VPRAAWFSDGWLRLLDLAPENATYSRHGLGSWIATTELAVRLDLDEGDARDLLTHVAQDLNGKVDPDEVLTQHQHPAPADHTILTVHARRTTPAPHDFPGPTPSTECRGPSTIIPR